MRSDPHASQKWRHPDRGISALVRRLNPLCQFVDSGTGQQCTRPSEVVHHIVDFKIDPERFFDWAVLVAVCKDHHQGGQIGETQGYLYCHTVGPAGAIYVQSARVFPCWHKDHKPRPNPLSGESTFLPPGSTASSVGDELLDRALAEPL